MLVKDLAGLLLKKKLTLVTAESCTGGLVAKKCTDLAGSSQWFDRGFITYSNQSKVDMLGVKQDVIKNHGAVSQQVAELMAKGALDNSQADISIAITGIAGPGGGSPKKPVGTVWIAWAKQNKLISTCYLLKGNRDEIRLMAAHKALNGVSELLNV